MDRGPSICRSNDGIPSQHRALHPYSATSLHFNCHAHCTSNTLHPNPENTPPTLTLKKNKRHPHLEQLYGEEKKERKKVPCVLFLRPPSGR